MTNPPATAKPDNMTPLALCTLHDIAVEIQRRGPDASLLVVLPRHEKSAIFACSGTKTLLGALLVHSVDRIRAMQ